MVNHFGSLGTLRIGETGIIAEVNNWSIEEIADTYSTGLSSWSGSINAYFEDDTLGQATLAIGTEVDLRVYQGTPDDTAPGEVYFSGKAIVTSISRSASFDGMTEASFSVQGNGELTRCSTTEILGRFTWQPWSDGSSEDYFGNISDNELEVMVAKDVPENYGRLFCDMLNATIKATSS